MTLTRAPSLHETAPIGYCPLMRIYRRAWWCVAGIAWVVGCALALVTVALGALIVISVFVGVSAIAFALASDGIDALHERGVAYAARYAIVGSAATVAVLGLIAGVGAAGLAISALLAATAPAVVERVGRWRDDHRAPEPTMPEPAETACSQLDTADLILAWRASNASLRRARTPASTTQIVERRQRYLDELERRDPQRVRRWLESGAPAADQ